MTRPRTALPGFGPVDAGGGRPRPRGWAHPERLALGVETLPGVGATLARRLRALGLETVGDVLLHRPRRYEQAADEVPISDLFGETRATADFAPVYPASEQVPSTRLRELVRAALEAHVQDVLDPLPAGLD